ncbi:MAG TPA: transglutaminase [Gammaproteobacteria bacterium]|nr:transglutaminase [Gammaproteobacteria bacterium]
MDYRIKHITEYRYNNRVSHCYNMAHLMPRDTGRQRCQNAAVAVVPEMAFSSTREDYFGNVAYHFEIQRPHKHLVITASSDVQTQAQTVGGDLSDGPSCRSVRRQLSAPNDADTLDSREFVLNSPAVHVSAPLREYAQASFRDDRPFLAAVMDLTTRIYQEFKYDPESTTVATPLAEVIENRHGVCQDFAHLQIGCLRALGFSAKYVSGYLETLPPPGKEKLIGADASHAWISVFVPQQGWVEFDPTNNCLAGEQHIVTAWGRDYFDVTPLKGVIFGGGDNPSLRVSVDVARVAPAAS